MMVLVSYDINGDGLGGQRRLRNIAKLCQDYGQRVQYSVFECEVDPVQWIGLKNGLLKIIDLERDSLMFYMLGANWKRRIEHFGAKPSVDFDSTLII
jgi:CRISPR-associated protein Cas2